MNLAELREKAEAVKDSDLLDGYIGKGGLYLNDAEYEGFIAAADPTTVLALIAVAEAASLKQHRPEGWHVFDVRKYDAIKAALSNLNRVLGGGEL